MDASILDRSNWAIQFDWRKLNSELEFPIALGWVIFTWSGDILNDLKSERIQIEWPELNDSIARNWGEFWRIF